MTLVDMSLFAKGSWISYRFMKDMSYLGDHFGLLFLGNLPTLLINPHKKLCQIDYII